MCSEPEEKGEDDTSGGIKADYPPDLALYLHLFPSGLVWPRQRAFSLGALPGQRGGREGWRETGVKKGNATRKERIKDKRAERERGREERKRCGERDEECQR